MKRKKRIKALAFLLTGAAFMAVCAALVLHNMAEDIAAGKAAMETVSRIEAVLEEREAEETAALEETSEEDEASTIYIDGCIYIGIIEIPSLELKLPVLAAWSYSGLKIAPCRYSGSAIKKTPFTFASTTHAIVRNGCTPVFCDINADDFTMDTRKLEDLITDQTSAIVPVHVYGNVCNIDEIERIANKYSLKVIYDAAHTFGERYKGRGIGSFGDVSCFSFHATKVFNSIEGGAVCFKDEEFGKLIYQLKNFGIHGPEVVDGIGANAKMNEFCAAMGICNLRHVDEEIAKRKKVVERYRGRLGITEGIQLNPIQEGVEPNYAYFPVVFDEKVFGASRNEVFDALAAEGIGARKYFYPLTNTFECFHGKYDANLTPVALHVSKRVLTLPLYADLAIEDVDRICDIILRCGK